MNGINVQFSDVLVYQSSTLEKGDSRLGRWSEQFFDFGQRRVKIARTPDWANDPEVLASPVKLTLQGYFSLLPTGYHKLYVAKTTPQEAKNGLSWWRTALRIVLCLTVVLPLFFAYQKYQYRKHTLFVEEEQERKVIGREEEIRVSSGTRVAIGMLYAKLFDSMDSINHYYQGGSVKLAILNLQVHLFNYLKHAQTQGLPVNLKNIERVIREMQASIVLTKQNLRGDALRKSLHESFESIPIAAESMAEADRPGCIIPGYFEDHGVMFVIYRTEESKYSLKIINTGVGAMAAPNSDDKVRDLIYTGLSISDLVGWLCVECNEDISKRDTQFHLDFIKGFFLKADGSNLTYGRVHHQQKKGSCYLKCVTSWLNGRLGDDYFAFKTYMSEKSLEDVQTLIDRVEKLDLYKKWRYVFGDIREGDYVKKWAKVKLASQKIIAKRQQKASRLGIVA